jgi:hypothetical protein
VVELKPVNRQAYGAAGAFTTVLLQAEANPNAIIYGTFYTYPFDEA